ncbi:MAG: hypothetical protein ACT4QC_10955 [Planctomycetaceae bacterium]
MAAAFSFPLVARAQEAPEKPQLEYNVEMVGASAGGIYAYAPGRWGILHLQLANRRDEPAELVCTAYFDSDPNLQYGRRVWLPPQSQVRTWHPILLPQLSGTSESAIPFHLIVVDAVNQTQLVKDAFGKRASDYTLKINHPGPVTGLMDRFVLAEAYSVPPDGDAEVLPWAFDQAMIGRAAQNQKRQVTHLADKIIPSGEERFDALDQLVIADDYALDDPAGMAGLRRWLFGGGRLWVMLDMVDPRLLENLLGDGLTWAIVDRIGLPHVALTTPAKPDVAVFESDYDTPVELVRVLAPDVDVVYLADGWPVAFWKQCGAGRLLVTTLGIDAFRRLRLRTEPAANDSSTSEVRFIPTDPMRNLAADLFVPRQPPALPVAALESQAGQYVGYEVPPRWLVTSILGAFSALLLVLGMFMWRTGRLERLGVVAPVLALVASGLLVYLGQRQREGIPQTVAVAQFVQPIVGTDDARISGSAGMYASDSGTAELGGTGGGWLMPDTGGVTGKARRLVWTDVDRWGWENFPQVPGVRSAAFEVPFGSPERVDARASFGPSGIVGSLRLPEGLRATDVVVAVRDGRLGATIDSDGSYTASADRVLANDQYLSAGAGGLLSDEQRRRSEVLRALFSGSAGSKPQGGGGTGDDLSTSLAVVQEHEYPLQPTLLFWTEPWETHLQFAEGTRRLGSALVAAPLMFERPAAGSRVTVPGPLLPYREVTGPDRESPTGLYNWRTRHWQQKSWQSSTWLKFQLPSVLLPFEPEVARFVVRVVGPVGNLTLSVWKDDQLVAVETRDNPVGTLHINLTDPDALRINPDGSLLLKLTAGKPNQPQSQPTTTDGTTDPAQAIYWRIESLVMELEGKVAGAPETARVAPGD